MAGAEPGATRTQEGPLGLVADQRDRLVVGGRRLGLAAEPEQQVGADLRWPSAHEVPEESQQLLDEITQAKVEQELELARRFFTDHRRYGEWAKSSRGLTHLTKEELDEFRARRR